jgi:putative peptide zinc metalloprotease protein
MTSTPDPIHAGALRLVPNTELLGPIKSSALLDPPSLVRRPDGQIVQLSSLFYAIARHALPGTSLAQIGDAAGAELELRITDEQVSYVLEHKLHPLGVVAAPDGSMPELQRLNPAFGLNHRIGAVRPTVVQAIARLFQPLFLPAVLIPLLGGLAAFDIWMVFFHGIGRGLSTVIARPGLFLLLTGLVYLSLAFHEAGHAAACRYAGGRPGAIGIGLYLVWPAFYTDVTDSYRFNRRDRLRTDLGGVYFNGIFALALASTYLATGFEPLLLAVVSQHLIVLNQFMPWIRLDGYYVVSDLIGVPDLFSRVRPILTALVRRDAAASPRVSELKPWARLAVSGWVMTTVAALTGGLVFIAITAPHYVRHAWTSAVVQWDGLVHSVSASRLVAVLADAVGLLFLALPVAGLLLAYVLVCRGMGVSAAKRRARRTFSPG